MILTRMSGVHPSNRRGALWSLLVAQTTEGYFEAEEITATTTRAPTRTRTMVAASA